MTNWITQQYQKLLNIYRRAIRWIKAINLKSFGKILLVLLNGLPGMIAWALEVASMVTAVVLIVIAGHLAYELRVWDAIVLIVIATMLVGVSILSDHYTSPSRSNKGGAS